jgi:NADPH:quinone reductase
MPKAIRIYQTGGPEMLAWEDVAVGNPGPGEARVRHTAVGVNFVDIYIRHGLYPAALPSGLGTEAAGVVEEIGPDVNHVKAGTRVAYAGGPLGAYAEERIMPADRLVALPDGISDQQAAAMMLKGMTVQYLIRQIHRVGAGDIILFHAAAGGVGLIACQWARSLGATVIGTVGDEQKAKVAAAHGCEHPIIYTREDFVARVATITKGGKLPVVYDSVGKDTFAKSLDCLRPKGLMVSFGQSSGAVGAIDLGTGTAADGAQFRVWHGRLSAGHAGVRAAAPVADRPIARGTREAALRCPRPRHRRSASRVAARMLAASSRVSP